MADTLRVGLVQVAYDPNEAALSRWDRIAATIRSHRDHDLLVLPELWAHGAFNAAAWHDESESHDGEFVQRIQGLASELGIVLHGGSFIEKADSQLWNTSVVAGPGGSILAMYRKIHRFGFSDGEPKYLEAGQEIVSFDALGTTIGLATCYDLRFPEQFRLLIDRGAEIFAVPASWPAARRPHWQVLGQARALEDQTWVLQANTVGTHAGVTMGGSSQVVSPEGTIVARASDDGEEVLSTTIDLETVRTFRREFPVLENRRIDIAYTAT